ncbi:MAG TPA: TolC family protein [Candidatus Binataceae bacterium]|nr:TolC family protein [Candidatus Binataceae bacterium]
MRHLIITIAGLSIFILPSVPWAQSTPTSPANFPEIGNPQSDLSAPSFSAEQPLPLPNGSQITLRQAVAIALQFHPIIAEVAAQTSAAEERVGEARSYLGPQLNAVSEYLRSTDNGIGNTSYYNPFGLFPRISGTNHDQSPLDTSQNWDTSNNYVGGATVSQFLFDFGRRRSFVEQRRFEAEAAGYDQTLAKVSLIFEVSQRYFNVLQAKQLVRVYEQAIEQRKFHLHEAEVKANAGLRPQLDVYMTKAALERAQLYLVEAKNSEDDAVAAFDNALGLGGRTPNYELVDVLTYSKINDKLDSLVLEAFKYRPDMKALYAQARAMGAQVQEFRSDYLPTVNAVAGYSAMGTGLPAANNFNAGIVITWPIFNSFLTTHEVQETKYRQKALESQIEDLRQRIILQVKTAYLDWVASLQRIVRAEEALAASRAELELAEKRYAAGLADIVELEDAQRNYTGDDAAYANALYGFSIARAAVDEATARGLKDLD